MKEQLLSLLVCPACAGTLTLHDPKHAQGEIETGKLLCTCGKAYPIRGFIPRFVDNDAYVDSFSFEWKTHSRTQLDSANTGTRMAGTSKKQFSGRIPFPLEHLKGKLVLDAGCGTGRFVEIAADAGAQVVGIDLSFAVECAQKNTGARPNVHLIQADIFRLPFRKGSFDMAYSFGVLHHTPDCAKAFASVAALIKKGGFFTLFVYSAYNKTIVYTSAFWRFFTTRLPKRLLYYACFLTIPLYFLYRIPVLGNICKGILVLPMWPDWRWRLLDAFDWYSPAYQSKHTHWEVYRWFTQAGFKDIAVYPEEVTMSGVKQ